MIILQWIIWAIALLFFVSFWYGLRRDAKSKGFGTGRPIHISLLIQTILLLLAVVLFLFVPWNKFHLLWIIPACIISSWIISFIIIPVPIIGDVLRNISLIFAYIFLVGTKWEIGGYPWEISTLRALKSRIKSEKYSTIEDFEVAIKRHEDQLFGIRLFNEGIKDLYSYDRNILDTTNYHFKNIMERGQKAISEAKELLKKVKSGEGNIKVLKKFEFPPIHGPGLDEMTQRATLLVKAYEKLFPSRPREASLTQEERKKLKEEALRNFEV